MWQAQIFTLYPEFFPGPLSKGLYGKAMSKNLWDLKVVNKETLQLISIKQLMILHMVEAQAC